MNSESDDKALGRVGEDYLKALWSAREWGGDPLTVSELASRFDSTKSTASLNLKRLASLGLVIHERYKPIKLTDAGIEAAKHMVRNHRLWETFLVQVLGYTWDEVHEPAEKLEHAGDSTLIDRIDAYLGHPQADPHGDPIPQPDGSVQYQEAAQTLFAIAPGTYHVVRVSDAEPDVLRTLFDADITPGATVIVSQDANGSRVLTTPAREIDLSTETARTAARAVIVSPLAG